MLNDTSVASAGSYIRTCRRIRNSKKIATIRDFHQNISVNSTTNGFDPNFINNFIFVELSLFKDTSSKITLDFDKIFEVLLNTYQVGSYEIMITFTNLNLVKI